jgi:hypothetical protein
MFAVFVVSERGGRERNQYFQKDSLLSFATSIGQQSLRLGGQF